MLNDKLSNEGITVTDDEKAIYDRQIRLWGLDAQNRLRNSSVLIAGLTGCGAEVAKNLMLAGLKSLTLLDHLQVTEKDKCCQFLIPVNSVGQNRAEASRSRCQMLNPNVDLIIDTENIAEKNDGYFRSFNLVILIDQEYSIIDRINKICRTEKIGFEAGGVYGWIGYGFFDFNNHTYLLKAPKREIANVDCEVVVGSSSSEDFCTPTKKAKLDDFVGTAQNGTKSIENDVLGVEDDEKIKTSVKFASWDEALNVDWTQKRLIRKARRILPTAYFPIRALLRCENVDRTVDNDEFLKLLNEELVNCNHSAESRLPEESIFRKGPQLSPTCAIVGAVVAQEAIKALSQNDAPLQNLFIYSAVSTTGVVCNLPPPV